MDTQPPSHAAGIAYFPTGTDEGAVVVLKTKGEIGSCWQGTGVFPNLPELAGAI